MQFFPDYMRTLHFKSSHMRMLIQHIKRTQPELEHISNHTLELMFKDYFYVLYQIIINYPGHDIHTEFMRMIPNMHKIRKSILYSIRKIRYWQSSDSMHQSNIAQEKAYIQQLWKIRNTILKHTQLC